MAKSKIAKPKAPRNSTIEKIAKEATKEQQRQMREAMKAYRHDLAILKRKGLISKSVDVRKVTKRQSNLTRAINEFRDVLLGKAVALKVPKEVLKRKQALSAKTRHCRIIEPKLPGEKVYVNPKGTISHIMVSEGGRITRIQPNVSPSNIEEYLQQIASQEARTKNKRYGFQYFGNNSHATFDNIELALMNLSFYSSLNQASASPSLEVQQEYITNLVFFKFERDVNFHTEVPHAKSDERLAAYRERQRVRREKWLANMSPEQYERFLERERERGKDKYHRMKDNESESHRAKRLEKKKQAERERRAKLKQK